MRKEEIMQDWASKGLQRTFEAVEVNEVEGQERTVTLSFSSEIAYERTCGFEVLDHTPGAMRTGRLNSGAALLINHDWSDQVGVVEQIEVSADRKGRAIVRFGRSQRAQEILQDVKDGIRKLVSVGYLVHGVRQLAAREGRDTFLVTDWEPFEISLVSVPADYSVGVGRNLVPFKEEKQMEDQTDNKVEDNKVETKTVKVDSEQRGMNMSEVRVEENRGMDQLAAERSRVLELTKLGELYDANELAREFIKNEQSTAAFQQALLERLMNRNSKPLSDHTSLEEIGLSTREVKGYSFMRAIRAIRPTASEADRQAAAFEFECSRAAEKAYGKEANGILIPDEVLKRNFHAGTPTSGGNLIETELWSGSFIDMLRNQTTIMKLGSTLTGLVGNVAIPKQTSGANAYWIGEGEDAREGSPAIGQIHLSPKTVAAYTEITRSLMQQSSLDAEGIVRRDLISALAQEIDRAGYYGTGKDKEPLGLTHYPGLSVVECSGSPSFADIVKLESEVAASNGDINRSAYVFNAQMRGHFKTMPKFGNGTEATIWETGNTINGHRTEVTNQLANGEIFYGHFADIVIGLWGGLDLTVDPYSLSKSGGLRIVVFQDVDFVLRRLESFCYGKANVKTTKS